MSLTFTVADMTVHRIIEQEQAFLGALDMFPDLTPALLAENRHWLQPAALDAQGLLVLCFQSYVIRTPHYTVLIDSCIGNDKQRARPAWNMKSDGTYLAALALAGLSVDDIDYVLCTHFHADHVGWNTKLLDGRWVPTFPKARYVFAESEYRHWVEQHAREPVVAFADSVLPIIEANRADIVGDDFQIGDHVRLLPTPGHTPGHVAVTLGRTGDDAVLTGDLIHSPLQMRYPAFSPRFDANPVQAAVTRRRFLERYCNTQTLCCTSHFPSPSVGRITQWGDGFRCDPVG